MNKGLFFLKCAVFGLFAITVFGLITMLLWNWLIPVLFNGPVITFWQAMGLLLLSKLLFWGFDGKRQCGCNTGQEQGRHWKHRFYEKFSNMTPEDREAIKEKMKEKWCGWDKKSCDQDSGK